MNVWSASRSDAGQSIHISPVTPLKVEVLEPNRALVLHVVMTPFTAEIVDTKGAATRVFLDWTWAFVLDQITPLTTWLIVRVRCASSLRDDQCTYATQNHERTDRAIPDPFVLAIF